MDHQVDPIDMLSQMDLEDTIRELEEYEVCEYIDALLIEQEINAGGDDNDGSLEFEAVWMSTISTTDTPVPRVVHPQTESKANLINKQIKYFSRKSSCHAAHQLGLPLILSFNGNFSSTGPLPHCGCNHCETCFHNNVLSLRRLMFHQKNDGMFEETRLSS
uniref:Uncharacterized protein n=1 Tax=viral metagenome TaxID=1070528 RepID=A0A6C0IYF6_9ZZZZ